MSCHVGKLALSDRSFVLGAPSLALVGSAGFPTILAVCLVRGVGLAVFVVAGGSLVATLLPAARRAEGLGWYGVVVGIPAVAALPLGVWLAERVGFPPVFIAAAAITLVALLTVPGLPGRVPGWIAKAKELTAE